MSSTLKDVAARAGVSIKTVSNVVNDYPHVAPDTRERVHRVIDLLGYQPNLPARHLRKARAGVIALAIPDLSNTYFSDIGHTVYEAASARSYTVVLDHTGGTRANELLVTSGLRPHLIDGVIMSSLSLGVEDVDPRRAGMPIVLLGEHLVGAPRDHVVIDNVAAAHLATTHLLTLGRQRVAVIGLQARRSAAAMRLRLRGFTEALTDAGQQPDPRLMVSAPSFHRADGARAMRHLLSLDRPPDAVFCFNDLLALGAIRALHEAGCQAPDDIAVVGFDDIEEGAFATPSLTTISPDKAEIGRQAVRLLLGRIDGTRTGPPELVEPPFKLVIRESSVGPARAARGSYACDDDVPRLVARDGRAGVVKPAIPAIPAMADGRG